MKTTSRFIIIDDDPLNNALCESVIKNALGKVDIQTFTLPERGFDFIASEYSKSRGDTPHVVLLDINMPTMTGWEFLEEFEKLDDLIKEQLSIYILTSSVNDRDREKAAQNQYVKDFIVKPLKKEKVLSIGS